MGSEKTAENLINLLGVSISIRCLSKVKKVKKKFRQQRISTSAAFVHDDDNKSSIMVGINYVRCERDISKITFNHFCIAVMIERVK